MLNLWDMRHTCYGVIRYRRFGAEANRTKGRLQDIRIATINYMQRSVKSFEEFCHNVEYFVDVVADYKADFITFPEMFTLQLLSPSTSA